MTRTLALAVCSFVFAMAALADDNAPLLIRTPAINGDKIAFAYAGEIWTVSRDGGDAQRLTSGVGWKIGPDLLVTPTTGGEPKRLTSHPGPDFVEGWTQDGKSILFTSLRTSSTDPPKL